MFPYQILEYNDYRKENYITIHGVTRDLEKAKKKVIEILQKQISNDKEVEDKFFEIYELPKDHCNEYVALVPRANTVSQYTYREISFTSLLNKTVKDLYDILEEKVPKSLSPDQILTKDVFYDLVHRKILKDGYLEFLHTDTGDICIDTYSTIIAIVECEEF